MVELEEGTDKIYNLWLKSKNNIKKTKKAEISFRNYRAKICFHHSPIL